MASFDARHGRNRVRGVGGGGGGHFFKFVAAAGHRMERKPIRNVVQGFSQ